MAGRFERAEEVESMQKSTSLPPILWPIRNNGLPVLSGSFATCWTKSWMSDKTSDVGPITPASGGTLTDRPHPL